jgi:hypothetical protein
MGEMADAIGAGVVLALIPAVIIIAMKGTKDKYK